MAPTWIVGGTLGDFVIKRKLLAWARKYYVKGGIYDGAIISGNLWDLKFEICTNARVIAQAKGKILTLRDRHNVELLIDSDQNELFVVISMIVLQLERKSEAAERNSNTA